MRNADSPNQLLYRFTAETDEARGALDRLQSVNVIGLDTETGWDPASKQWRVSLVQIAARTSEVLIIDALAVDLEVVRSLIESPTVSMAAHNARFDHTMLTGAGLRPRAFVDTLHLARTALRLPSYTLAAVTQHLLGIELDKEFQKANWRRRPLTAAQLAYAAMDAQATLDVYEKLCGILEEQGRLREALQAATLTEIAEGDASSTRVRRHRRRCSSQHSAAPLTKEEKRAVAHLKEWRLRQAHESRRPAYMICSDRTLEDLVRTRPTTLDALRSIYGLGETKIAQLGAELLEALHSAFEESQESEENRIMNGFRHLC